MKLDDQEKKLLLGLLNKLLGEDSSEETKEEVPEKVEEVSKPKRGRKPKKVQTSEESEDLEKTSSKIKLKKVETSNSKEAKFIENKFVDDLSLFKNDLKFNKQVDFKVSKRQKRDNGLVKILCDRCDKEFLGLPNEFICNRCAIKGRSKNDNG